jgi:hypothetical protein
MYSLHFYSVVRTNLLVSWLVLMTRKNEQREQVNFFCLLHMVVILQLNFTHI